MPVTGVYRSTTARNRYRCIPIFLNLTLIIALILGGLVALTPLSPVGAAAQQLAAFSFTVNSTEDLQDFDTTDGICNATSDTGSPAPTGDCTLRAAVQQANALAVTDPANTFTVILAAGAEYLLNVGSTVGQGEDDAATGDLDIKANVTIAGNGATINGNGDALAPESQDRAFHVFGGFTVVIDNVMIFDAYAYQANGGGILNDGGVIDGGSLTVSNSTLKDNATGGNSNYNGGAIYNGYGRTLTLTNTTLSGNSAGNGGGFHNDGTATITGSTISANTASGGGSGPFGSGGGGGIFNFGTLTVSGSSISGNSSFVGGGLSSGFYFGLGLSAPAETSTTLTDTVISNNSALFAGGGIANGFAPLTMNGGAINANTASGFIFVFNAGGIGGGLANTGDATLTGVTVNGNSASVFGTGENSGGLGGGIANAGALAFDRGTISNNVVSGPGAGGGLVSGTAQEINERLAATGQSAMAELASIETVATITNSTISGNSATDGGGGVLNDDDSTATLVHVTVASNQGNLSNQIGETNVVGVLNVQNSIVAYSGGYPNCVGPIMDNGYNVEDGSSCAFTSTGSVSGVDPQLGPLQVNAPGTTATRAIQSGSPATDRVPASGAGCLPTDQRGVTRPIGTACDSGAYEGLSGFLVTVTVVGDGSITPGTGIYPTGSTQSFTATAGDGSLFLGWYVDDQLVGFSNPLNLPVTRDRAVRAEFAPNPTFCDVGPGKAIDASDPAYTAIVNLTARGVIKGKVNAGGQGGPTCFDAESTASRAEAAAFIARTFGWDDETYPNPFRDRCNDEGCIDAELWNDIAVLHHYGVVEGYNATTFGPFDRVSRVQMISLISRAFDTFDGPKPDWNTITVDDNTIYGEVLPTSPHRLDVVTYAKNAGIIPGTPSTASWPNDPNTGQNSQASRGFVAQALWQAYAIYFGTNRVP